jgi:hypothetical protein
VEVRVADHRPFRLAEHDRAQRPREPIGSFGDLIASEADKPQRLTRERVGDREVGEPARGVAIVRDQRIEQRRWQRDEIEA